MPSRERKEAAAAVRNGKTREEFVSWLADQFDRSRLARGLATPVASMPPPPAILLDDTTLSRYPTAICTQTCVVLRRVFLFKMREPEAMATQFFNLVINPVMFGAIYWQMPLTLTGVSDRFGFISLLFLMNAFAAIDALTLFPKERQVFLRDTNANLYGTLAYYVGRTVAELPSLVLFSVLGSLVAIYMAGLNQEIDRVGVFILANTLMTVTGASLLIFVSSLGRTMAEANAVGVVVLMLAMMFNGFFIQEENTPDVFKWISRISFLHFGLKVGMRNELEGLTIVCQPQETGCSTDGASYLTTGSGEDEMWAAIGWLFLTNGILRVLTFFTLHFLFTGQTWAVRARQLCEW